MNKYLVNDIRHSAGLNFAISSANICTCGLIGLMLKVCMNVVDLTRACPPVLVVPIAK